MTSLLVYLFAAILASRAYCTPDTGSDQYATIPSFVNTYAPVVYLHSAETYFPSDLGAQLTNTQPQIDFQPVVGAPTPLTLDNLDSLNALNGSVIYLTSLENTASDPQPAWLRGVIPDSSGKTDGAVSTAIVINDYENGTVLAFYMFFYAYNWGGIVFDLNFDDHVGDWEHTMITFENGVPTTMWYSQHQDGEAFAFSAVPKFEGGNRPIVYSANGSHANYATSGTHDHTIPGLDLPIGLFLIDHTDAGHFWDPTLSAYYAQVHFADAAAPPVFAAFDDATPVRWLDFVGKWGDEQYPRSFAGQYDLFGQARYSSGPTGPEAKHLNRGQATCPSGLPDPCVVLPYVIAGQ